MTVSINDKIEVETTEGVFRGYVRRIAKEPDFQHRHLVRFEFRDIPDYYVDGLLELGDIVITLRTIGKENENAQGN